MHRCTPLQNNPPCRFPLAGVPPGAMAMGPIRLRACPAGRIHAAHSALLRGTHRVLPFVARRVLSSASQPDPSEQVATAIGSLPPFADAALRGVGQVVFCNSPGSGALILAGLGVADPFLASMATLGVTTSTAAAMMGGLDRAAINSGLYGYNGALVGCAFSVFLGTSLPVTLAATTAGAAATPFVGRAIAPLCASVPQFTLAFNAVALSTLAVVCPFKAASVAPETPIEVVVGTAADTIPPATVVTGVAELMMSPLTGISQIFVVESPLSGALLLGAIAFYSPSCAFATFAGSSVGSAIGAVLDAPAADIAAGLWGYNPALSALAVSVFFVPTPAAGALALGSSAAAAGIFSIAAPAFAATFATPCLTVPFCTAAIGAHMLAGRLPGLVLAVSPHSPERNTPPTS